MAAGHGNGTSGGSAYGPNLLVALLLSFLDKKSSAPFHGSTVGYRRNGVQLASVLEEELADHIQILVSHIYSGRYLIYFRSSHHFIQKERPCCSKRPTYIFPIILEDPVPARIL